MSWRRSLPPSRLVDRFVTEPSSSSLGRSDALASLPLFLFLSAAIALCPAAIPFLSTSVLSHPLTLISPLCRSVDLFDGPWPTDGLLDALAAFGTHTRCDFLVTNTQDPAVVIFARLLYLFASSLLASAPFFCIPYLLIKAMDVDEREEMRMDTDGPDLESAAPVQGSDSRELPFPKLSPDGFVETQYLSM